MRPTTRAGLISLAGAIASIGSAMGQPAADAGCTASASAANTQTWRCGNGITIVAESGARFELRDANGDGRIDSVELSSKAVLVHVPKKPGGTPFKVLTPQAIAAVRGTKWAVDAAEARTSVFVAEGRVGVTPRSQARGVVLGPGEGVDVEPNTPLTVKTWGRPRVDALMARLGQ